MPYSRKAPKADIRSLALKSLPKSDTSPTTPSQSNEPPQKMPATFLINPTAELFRVAVCFIPLAVILAIASYWDIHRAWVVPLAQHFLKLGS